MGGGWSRCCRQYWLSLDVLCLFFCSPPQADGTLGEVFDVISKSDMVVLLISDAAQVGCFA